MLERRQKINRREAAGEALYVNPRNTTAGTIRLLDSREVARRRLEVTVYQSVTDLGAGPRFHLFAPR